MVPLLAVCLERFALVYPRAEGTLEGRLRSCTRSQPSDNLSLVLGAARGLLALHSRGFVHRDVKSANIFLFATGVDGCSQRAQLGDYGQALKLPSSSRHASLVGTPAYMDPEAIAAGFCTFSSDIFSFGVVMLEVLLGRSVTELRQDARPLWNQFNEALCTLQNGKVSALRSALAFIQNAGANSDWSLQTMEILASLVMECISQDSTAVKPHASAVVEHLEMAGAAQASPQLVGYGAVRTCTICFEQEINARLQPCCHAVTCSSCAPLFLQSDCPLCRCFVENFEIGHFESTYVPEVPAERSAGGE